MGGGWSYGNEEVLGGERGKSKKRDFWEIPDSLSPHRSVLTVLELLDLETCRNKIFVAESTVEKNAWYCDSRFVYWEWSGRRVWEG